MEPPALSELTPLIRMANVAGEGKPGLAGLRSCAQCGTPACGLLPFAWRMRTHRRSCIADPPMDALMRHPLLRAVAASVRVHGCPHLHRDWDWARAHVIGDWAHRCPHRHRDSSAPVLRCRAVSRPAWYHARHIIPRGSIRRTRGNRHAMVFRVRWCRIASVLSYGAVQIVRCGL